MSGHSSCRPSLEQKQATPDPSSAVVYQFGMGKTKVCEENMKAQLCFPPLQGSSLVTVSPVSKRLGGAIWLVTSQNSRTGSPPWLLARPDTPEDNRDINNRTLRKVSNKTATCPAGLHEFYFFMKSVERSLPVSLW